MSARPWHKRYHSDALTGFRPLSLEERGAYQTLLDMMYDTGGSIPDNERYLAGAMNATMGRWRKLRQSLIDQGKIGLDGDGRIVNDRVLAELEKTKNLSESASKSGKKGAKNKQELAKKANENSGGGENSLEGRPSHIRGQKPEEDQYNIDPLEGGASREDQGDHDGGERQPSKYAYEGAVIRLTHGDFGTWRTRYHAIPDIMAELGTPYPPRSSLQRTSSRTFRSPSFRWPIRLGLPPASRRLPAPLRSRIRQSPRPRSRRKPARSLRRRPLVPTHRRARSPTKPRERPHDLRNRRKTRWMARGQAGRQARRPHHGKPRRRHFGMAAGARRTAHPRRCAVPRRQRHSRRRPQRSAARPGGRATGRSRSAKDPRKRCRCGARWGTGGRCCRRCRTAKGTDRCNERPS